MSEQQRYPLSWPTGWKRSTRPIRARFSKGTRQYFEGGGSTVRQSSLSVSQAIDRLRNELRRLGVRESDWLLSTNIKTRLDGLPYSNAAEPSDPGAAVYFRLGAK